MKRRHLRIGNLTFEYPFVLAPLAGITDRSMRSLCSQAGASLTFTEMVSAKGLWYGDRKTGDLLKTGLQEGSVGFQLFGSEPPILEYAVRLLSDPDHAKAVDAQMAAQMEEGSASAEGTLEQPALEVDADMQNLAARTKEAGLRVPLGARTAEDLLPPVLFDLNAGCPVPKIVRNGEGSALLKDPALLYDCVAAMVRGANAAGADAVPRTSAAAGIGPTVGLDVAAGEKNARQSLPVTVKIRKGFERDDDCAVEIAKAAEAAGAAAVTVHGRTRAQFYEGRADWDVIARVKAAVKIPVIGNGDITCGADAIRMMEETGCDGVMIARGALGNPWIFAQARALWDALPCGVKGVGIHSGTDSTYVSSDAERLLHIASPTDQQRIDLLLHHLDMVCEDKGERVAVREMRKHVGWYIKGMRGATQIRRQINTAGSISEMKQILQEL